MKNKLTKTHISIITIVCGMIALSTTAYAWTGPTGTAPNSNASAPLNISSAAQTKAGSLGLTGNLIVSGSAGFGSASAPAYTVDVTGQVRATTGFVGNASTATALAANGTNCAVGSYPLGVDASGNAETCTAIGTSVTGSGTASYIPKWSAASALTNSLIYDTGTNIGIGTTSPSAKFTVAPTAVSGTPALTGSATRVMTNTFTDNVTAASGTVANFVANSIEAPTLASTNTAVTTTNAYTSYVAGAPIKGTNNTASNAIALGVGAGAVGAHTRSYGLYVNTQTGATNNYAAVFAGGNVGIGTTAPAYALDVTGQVRATTGFVGNASTATALAANGSNCSTGYYPLGIDASGNVESCTVIGSGVTGSGTASYLTKWATASTVGNSVIYDNGTNVGIGTTSPGDKLEVVGGMYVGNASSKFWIGPSGGINYIESGNGAWNASANLNICGFNCGTGGTMTVNYGTVAFTNGNVGVGTSSPGYKLDVSGTAHVSGATTHDGTVYLTQGASTRNVGIVGSYDPTKLAAIWSMGSGYEISSTGAAGSLYGLSYSYEPNYGAAGNNPGAISGLGHQMQWRSNGATQTAIGTGIWTVGSIYTGAGGISDSAGTRMDAGGGWLRTYGSSGWYNQTYGGGWYMIDSTWIRSYGSKYMYVDTVIQAGSYMNAPAYYYISDARLKKDLQQIDSPLEKINKLNGYYFKWKKNDAKDIGLIAQEVEKVFPDVVHEYTDPESKEVYKNVEYGHLIAPVIEAIKELSHKFTGQQTQLDDKQAQLDSQQRQLVDQQKQIINQQKEIDELKSIVRELKR